MLLRKIILYGLICFAITGNPYQTAKCQPNSNIDSLRLELVNAKHDSTRLDLNIKIGKIYLENNLDSARYYFNISLQIAEKLSALNTSPDKKLLDKMGSIHFNLGEINLNYNYDSAEACYSRALDLYRRSGNKKEQAEALNSIAIVKGSKGDFYAAIDNFKLALKLNTDIDDPLGVANNNSNIGFAYIGMGQYTNATGYLMECVKIYEKLVHENPHEIKYKSLCANSYNLIGNVYCYLKYWEKSIYYFNQALKLAKEINSISTIANSYGNLGNMYSLMDSLQLSKDYYLKALEIFQKLKIDSKIAVVNMNLGIIYNGLKQHKLAEELLLKAFEYFKKVSEIANVATCATNLGELYNQIGNYETAIFYFTEGVRIGEKSGSIDVLSQSYSGLSNVYEKNGDLKKALSSFRKHKIYSDSIFNIGKNEKLIQMEAEYQNEKKQIEINLLEKDSALHKTTIQKQRIAIYFFISGLLFLVSFLVVVYRFYNQKRKDNKLLLSQKLEIFEKNEELKQQNEEIVSQRDYLEIINKELEQKNEEIKTQRDEIENQRDLLEKQNMALSQSKQKITDSISYAQRIQQALMPHKEKFASLFQDYFVLYRPKDIVSGDFYWIHKTGDKVMLAVVDSTGHGVPGAFMSMLGFSFLNDMVRNNSKTDAANLLNDLRKVVIENLQQKGQILEQKDGFDICLAIIDLSAMELQYAGANIPLYIMNQKSGICKLEPDNMPVSIHIKMDPFNNKIHKLEKGEILYLASDGFEDQFGGTKNKKFLSSKLQELLVASSSKPMAEQLSILNQTYEGWKGQNEQIDDVTILGIQV